MQIIRVNPRKICKRENHLVMLDLFIVSYVYHNGTSKGMFE